MKEIFPLALPYLIVGAVFLLLALWSRDPKHLGSAIGKLAGSKHVWRQYRHSNKKHRETACVYLYEVNGKTYRLKHSGTFSRKSLMPRVTVVYLKGLPRFGFLEKYPTLPLTLLGCGGILTGCCILLAPYV